VATTITGLVGDTPTRMRDSEASRRSLDLVPGWIEVCHVRTCPGPAPLPQTGGQYLLCLVRRGNRTSLAPAPGQA
jgi:hypothetical protein